MMNTIKKYVILFFVIMIPLLAAFWVGQYGYKSEKFGQGTWKTEFRNEYLKFTNSGTTEEQIDEYLKFGVNSQYFSYDPNPVYEKTFKNTNNDNIFKMRIYRALYTYTENEQKVSRIQYIYFIYDIQYLKIRQMFTGDAALRQEIEKANVPAISINLYEQLDGQEGDKDFVSITASKILVDTGADVDYQDGTIVPVGGSYSGNAQNVFVVAGFDPLTDINWSNKTKIEVVAYVPGVVDNNNDDIKTTIGEETLDYYYADPTDVDTDDYLESFQQNVDKMGYFTWVFKNYLWWIGLIAFVSIGFITGSFYLVWLAEEQRERLAKLNKKAKK